MILKIGRCTDAPCQNDKFPAKILVWEYVEKVSSVIVNRHETPMINSSEMCEVTDVSYFINSGKNAVDSEHVATIILSGADVCYLMNDEGKTIERIR